MSSLDGLRVALIGRLRYGHASLRTALRDAGAVCARDVDLQVDVAVVGLAGGGKLARARTLGIPTVDEDTLRSWLDGAPVMFGE